MIYNLLNLLKSKDIRVFIVTFSFHLSLYFSTSNKITFLLSIFLLVVLYLHLKRIPLTLFYLFLIMLPFAKGKGIDILLLDKKFILKNAIFNIDYLFPFYISSFYLLLFYLFFLREKLFFKRKNQSFSKKTKFLLTIFILFIILNLFNSSLSAFYLPVFLSSIQLFILLLIFFIPFVLKYFNNRAKDLSMIIASSTLFQSLWLIMQTIKGSHLNRDIEVFLPGFEFGIKSTENFDLARLPGTFFESSILGTFLLTNIAILISMLINNKIKYKNQRIIIFITIILGNIAILLTGSRAIYLVTALLLTIILFLKKKYLQKHYKKTLAIFKKKAIYIVITLLGLIFVAPYVLNRFSSIDQIFSKEGSGTYRIQLSEYSLKLMTKKPLTGVGLNLSPYYLATAFTQESYFFDPAHPHNIIIQLLVETGLLGTSLFVLFIYLIYRPYLQGKNKNNNEFFLGSLVFFICAQLYPIFINHMEIISYFFLYLGFTLFNSEENNVK